MRSAAIEKGIPALFAALGTVLIWFWISAYLNAPLLPDRPLGHEHSHPVTPAAAGPTGAATLSSPQPLSGSTPPATTGSFYNPAITVPNLPGDWPGFRGPNRDNIYPGSVPLAKQWDPQGPKTLWSTPLGEGYAGAAVHAGRVYVLDYDQPGQSDALRCFSLADGTEIWRRSYPVVVKRNHGMSRTIPAVTDKYVVSLGPKCHVLCADAKTGDVRWFKDLVKEFDASVPEWYAGQCPLIDGDKVIIAPGGKTLMIAVDLATGKVAWQTPNPSSWQMTHSSIMPMTIEGQKMYVYCASGGVAGVSAKDGELLWQTTEWTINTATVPSPVSIGNGRIFLTGGYGAGSMVLQISLQEGKFTPRVLTRIAPEVFGSEQQTPILFQDHLYGIASGGQLVCLSLDGRRMWESGSLHRFGLGPLTIVDGVVYAMDDKGSMSLVKADPGAFSLLAQAKVFEGQDAWAPMAIAGSRLLVRDMTHLYCVDIGSS